MKSEATDTELESKRRQVEEKMYWARHDGTSPQERQQLENEWNDIRRQQTATEAKEGKKVKEWKDKHDRRDEFEFTKEKRQNTKGEEYEVVSAKGRVHDPESTINWRRDTHYGAVREAQVRKSVAGGTGDDAGHLIRAEWGADPEGVNAGGIDRKGNQPGTETPAERLNYGHQHRGMNRGTGYKDVEDGISREAKGSSKPVDVEVTTHWKADRFEGEREYSRTISAKDQAGKPMTVSRPDGTQISVEDYQALNPSSPSYREAQARQNGQSPTPDGTASRHSENNVVSLYDNRHRTTAEHRQAIESAHEGRRDEYMQHKEAEKKIDSPARSRDKSEPAKEAGPDNSPSKGRSK